MAKIDWKMMQDSILQNAPLKLPAIQKLSNMELGTIKQMTIDLSSVPSTTSGYLTSTSSFYVYNKVPQCYFCENPKCPHHKLVYEHQHKWAYMVPSVYLKSWEPMYQNTPEPMHISDVGHKKWHRQVGDQIIDGYFCDICSAAIEAMFG